MRKPLLTHAIKGTLPLLMLPFPGVTASPQALLVVADLDHQLDWTLNHLGDTLLSISLRVFPEKIDGRVRTHFQCGGQAVPRNGKPRQGEGI